MSFLFGISKIQGEELRKCLVYLEEELRFSSFQDKEAERYNKAMLEWSIAVSSQSSDRKEKETKWHQAADRLSEAANEILRRRSKMFPIPDQASAMYFAWQLTYSDFAAWTSAQATVVKGLNKMYSLDAGIPPISNQLQKSLEQSEDSRRKAMKEMKKFLKRLNLSGTQYQTIFDSAITTISNENWQPKRTIKPRKSKS